jgi:hypothetical protein
MQDSCEWSIHMTNGVLLRAHRRITGQERVTLSQDFVQRYAAGESIRTLAHTSGRSYGFVHRILTEAGVTLRRRGGDNHRRKPTTTRT